MAVVSDIWLEAASTRLPGAPLVALQQEWLWAAREFFSRSTAWRHTLPAITIVAGTDLYSLTSDVTDASINQVHQASIPDRYLSPSSQHPVVLGNQESETPTQFSSPNQTDIRLWPKPSKEITDGLLVTVSLIPTSLTTAMPDYLGNQFFEPLLDGMLGKMMNYPNRPFSNDTKAAYHLRRFRSGMARARNNAIHGLNESSNTWNYPGFARGRMYL